MHPAADEDDDAPLYPTGGALAYRINQSATDPSLEISAAAPLSDGGRNVRRQPRTADRAYDETLRASPGGSFRRTLSRAFERHAAGKSVRVILAPGIYRDSFAVGPAQSGAHLLIEAAEPGKVILSGSDEWRGWEVRNGVWQSRWPHKWGLGNAPDTYGDPNLATADLMRRREMIFVNGRLHRQVLDRRDIEPGCFAIDEANELIFLRPAEDLEPRRALVEAGVRSGLMDITGRSNLTFRGLRFEHDASFYFTPQRGALQLSNCRGVLVEDCSFQWNNTK
ncbi:MAG: hypothetical protein ACREKL_01095, partial [Chthoniobacterales bacterium]